MKKLLDPAYWARALRNPIVLIGLVVDLLPIFGVLLWGWGATPLVMLYWTENIIAGIMTLPRIFISAATFRLPGLLLGVFLCAFFVFHYGLFCAVHGTFLIAFIGIAGDYELINSGALMDVPAMIRFGLDSAPHVIWIAGAIFAFQVLLFFWDFIIKGEWKTSTPLAEMFAPYGRIVVLHFAIFAGAAGLFLLGEPMVGVLALILLRAAWGVVNNSKGGWDQEIESKMPSREAFEKMLQGKDPSAT